MIARRLITILIMLATVSGPTGCGKGSDPSAAEPAGSAPPWFEEVAASSGVDFRHVSGHEDVYYMPEIMAGGAALIDFDADGDLDLYLVQSGRVTESHDPAAPGNRLYRNDGDGVFVDVTEGSGADDRGYGLGAAAGDYDGDGDTDLYVTNLGRNTLLRNEGGGRFTDVSDAAGAGGDGLGSSAAFADLDGDQDLDLFVCNYVQWTVETELPCSDAAGDPDYCTPESYNAPAPDELFRNNGDGTFTEVSAAAGLRRAFGNGLGVVCGDLVGDDGLIDIYVANDLTPNQLWRNRGDLTFEDVAPTLGCAVDRNGEAKAGMGTIAADVDDDGDLDLAVVNLQGQTDSLYLNEGTYFSDETARFGLSVASRPFTRFGMALTDFDNDGQLDAYYANGRVFRSGGPPPGTDDPYAEPNLLLRGDGTGRFERVEPTGGTARVLLHTSRGAAFGDLDNDGGIDVVVANRDAPPYVLRNVVTDRGHWLMVRAVDESGTDAIGAVVRLRVGDRAMMRDVKAAYSYCASNDPRVHFGLGTAARVDDVTVRWPDGTLESFGALDADRIVTLRRGGGTAEAGG